MQKRVIFLQDFFIEDFLGGAELHDDVVIKHLDKIGILYAKKKNSDLTAEYIHKHKDKVWFISNFSTLKPEIMGLLMRDCKYLIYEHDYKFIDTRNPINFKNFIVPEKRKININFYNLAHKVICLSKMHREIFEKNMNLLNLENINCSMWSDQQLELFTSLLGTQKKAKFAVINSQNKIKKTKESVEFCRRKGLDFDLISSSRYEDFIGQLAQYSGLVFMTGHPEPTPRVAIEAKMLGCKFIAQKDLIGVAHEDYFSLTGSDMIDKVRSLRDEALTKIEGWINEV